MVGRHSVAILLLSIALAVGLFLLLGLHEHAFKLLHQWFFGVACLFVVVFAILAVVCLRGRLAETGWVFPVCVALSYVAAFASKLTYFAIFEPERTMMLKHVGPVDFIKVELFSSTLALVWVFALFVAAFRWSLQRFISAHSTQVV